MRPRVVLAAGVALLIAALVVDGVTPAVARREPELRIDAAGGVLACPFGVSAQGRAYAYLANVGESPARARVIIQPDRGRRAIVEASLPAQTVRTVRLHRRVEGSATVFIEHTGRLVATHSLWLGAGGAAGSCARAADRRLVLAHGSTRDVSTTLALANPGTADADVSVRILADGELLEPESLRRRVVRSRRRLSVRLDDFAFDAEDVTAIVQTNTGRVVAETRVDAGDGVALLDAVPPLGRAAVVLGDGPAPRRVSVAAVGDEEDAALDARLLTGEQRGAARGIPPSLVPGASAGFVVPRAAGRGPAAYMVEVTAGGPIGAGGTWRRRARRGPDRAMLEALPPAVGWAGVVGSDQDASQVRALVVNPGELDLVVEVLVIDVEGSRIIELTVPAGRIAAQRLGRGRGTWALMVRAPAAIGVALEVTSAGSVPSLMAAAATRMLEPEGVSVILDPRAGVAGRLPALAPDAS